MTEAEMIQCAIDEGFAAAAIVDTTQIYLTRPSVHTVKKTSAVSMVLTTPAHPIAVVRRK